MYYTLLGRPLFPFPIKQIVLKTSVQDVDDVFEKYDPKGTGYLDVHNFVMKIINPGSEPDPWFRDRATYEFHVLNRAPMKKVQCSSTGRVRRVSRYMEPMRKIIG